jgi:hypothetical protein
LLVSGNGGYRASESNFNGLTKTFNVSVEVCADYLAAWGRRACRRILLAARMLPHAFAWRLRRNSVDHRASRGFPGPGGESRQGDAVECCRFAENCCALLGSGGRFAEKADQFAGPMLALPLSPPRKH